MSHVTGIASKNIAFQYLMRMSNTSQCRFLTEIPSAGVLGWRHWLGPPSRERRRHHIGSGALIILMTRCVVEDLAGVDDGRSDRGVQAARSLEAMWIRFDERQCSLDEAAAGCRRSSEEWNS